MEGGKEIGPLISKRDKAIAVPQLKENIKQTKKLSDKDAQESPVF